MANHVLIGSAAVELHRPGLLKRQVKDRDFLTLAKNPAPGEDFIDGTNILDSYSFGDVATLDEVYTLKVSHSFWVINQNSWHKHLRDIYVLKQNGCVLIPELYNVAYAEWANRKGVKKVNLAQDRTEFFGSNVKRLFDHDSVHAALAFNESALYENILQDGQDILPAEAKFNALTFEQKCRLVEEEVSVLATERILIPKAQSLTGNPLVHDFEKIDLYQAYGQQLQLLITQYSKGYFPLFIVENYFDVFKPARNYWATLQKNQSRLKMYSNL